MRTAIRRLRSRVAQHIGPEALAAMLTALAVLLVVCLAWALLGAGS